MPEQDFGSKPDNAQAKLSIKNVVPRAIRNLARRRGGHEAKRISGQQQQRDIPPPHPQTDEETQASPEPLPSPNRTESAYNLACNNGDILGACQARGEDLGIDPDRFRSGVAQIQVAATGDTFTIIVADAAKSGFSQVREFYSPLSPKFIGRASDSEAPTPQDTRDISSLVGLYKHSLLPGSFSLVSPTGVCLYGLVVKGELAEPGTETDLQAVFTQAGYTDVDTNYMDHMEPLQRVDGRPPGHYEDDLPMDTDKGNATLRPSASSLAAGLLPEQAFQYKERRSSGVKPSHFPDPMEWYHNNALMEPYEENISSPDDQKPEKLLLDAWQ